MNPRPNPWRALESSVLSETDPIERVLQKALYLAHAETLPPHEMVREGRYHDLLRIIDAHTTKAAEKERILYRVKWGTGDRLNVRAHPELARCIERLALPGEDVGDVVKRLVCDAMRKAG